MGCCWGKGDSNEADALEMGDVTNAAVLCRIGKTGEGIKVDMENQSFRVSGKGTALGSSMLDCDIGYWEVKLGKNPQSCRVGIKRFNPKRPTPLNDVLKTGEKTPSCWILDPKELGEELKEGQVIGIHWDQSDLPMVSYTVDGVLKSKASITRIRPTNDLYPAVSVTNGATVELVFNEEAFEKKPWASKFRMIVSATNMLG